MITPLPAWRGCAFFLLVTACSDADMDLEEGSAQANGQASKIALSPSAGVGFGAITVGDAATATVRVVNTGLTQASLKVETRTLPRGVSLQGGTCGPSVVPNTPCTLALSFAPEAAGAVDGELGINGVGLKVSAQGIDDPTLNDGPGGAAVLESLGHLTITETVVASPYRLGTTAPLQVTVKDDDASITIYASTRGGTAKSATSAHDLLAPQDVGVLVAGLQSPDGVRLIGGLGWPAQLNRSDLEREASATTVPQSPDLNALFVAGTYTFAVWVVDHRPFAKGSDVSLVDDGSGSAFGVEVYVVHTKRAKNTKRQLNLELYFSGSCGLSAATAQAHPVLQDALAEMRRLYSEQAGISIGSIASVDIDAGYRHTNVDDLDALFAHARSGSDALRFFFVEELSAGEVDGVLGIAGGIPGPFTAPNGRSGIAVLCDDDTDGIALGATLAHEGGHYLGLFHTVESDCFEDGAGCTNDNVSDTKALGKPLEQGAVSEAAANLMFFSATDSAKRFSAMQRETLRRAALVGRE